MKIEPSKCPYCLDGEPGSLLETRFVWAEIVPIKDGFAYSGVTDPDPGTQAPHFEPDGRVMVKCAECRGNFPATLDGSTTPPKGKLVADLLDALCGLIDIADCQGEPAMWADEDRAIYDKAKELVAREIISRR